MALELIPTFKRPLGSDIPKDTIRQQSKGCFRAIFPFDQVKDVREGPAIHI